jgi:hypothetical protein
VLADGSAGEPRAEPTTLVVVGDRHGEICARLAGRRDNPCFTDTAIALECGPHERCGDVGDVAPQAGVVARRRPEEASVAGFGAEPFVQSHQCIGIVWRGSP